MLHLCAHQCLHSPCLWLHQPIAISLNQWQSPLWRFQTHLLHKRRGKKKKQDFWDFNVRYTSKTLTHLKGLILAAWGCWNKAGSVDDGQIWAKLILNLKNNFFLPELADLTLKPQILRFYVCLKRLKTKSIRLFRSLTEKVTNIRWIAPTDTQRQSMRQEKQWSTWFVPAALPESSPPPAVVGLQRSSNSEAPRTLHCTSYARWWAGGSSYRHQRGWTGTPSGLPPRRSFLTNTKSTTKIEEYKGKIKILQRECFIQLFLIITTAVMSEEDTTNQKVELLPTTYQNQ